MTVHQTVRLPPFALPRETPHFISPISPATRTKIYEAPAPKRRFPHRASNETEKLAVRLRITVVTRRPDEQQQPTATLFTPFRLKINCGGRRANSLSARWTHSSRRKSETARRFSLRLGFHSVQFGRAWRPMEA